MPLPAVRTVDDEYDEIYAFLCGMERFGILLGLENISCLLNQLGDPQIQFPVVHVTGSNGKGSTSAMVSGILQAAGYTSALYTSPHLNDFRERIRVNGSMISKEALISSARKIESLYDPQRTTFFEFTTAIAFDYFAQVRPDIALIEVGLGGRLDATNMVRPLVTVITDVSREHEDYLGVGIESVAREKAGIIKPGVPVITGASRSKARNVIYETAADRRALVREFGRDFVGIRTGPDRFTYRSGSLELQDIVLAMPGAYQVKNAALACAVVEELRTRGYRIPDEAVRSGILNTRFPGRFELIRRCPDVIIDGAHTPESMRLLKSTLRSIYPSARPFVLTGMLREKDWRQMAGILASVAREVVCVPPQGNRALDPEELAVYMRDFGIPVTASPSISRGFESLMRKASEKNVILAAGSLYMICPVRRACGLSEE